MNVKRAGLALTGALVALLAAWIGYRVAPFGDGSTPADPSAVEIETTEGSPAGQAALASPEEPQPPESALAAAFAEAKARSGSAGDGAPSPAEAQSVVADDLPLPEGQPLGTGRGQLQVTLALAPVIRDFADCWPKDAPHPEAGFVDLVLEIAAVPDNPELGEVAAARVSSARTEASAAFEACVLEAAHGLSLPKPSQPREEVRLPLQL